MNKSKKDKGEGATKTEHKAKKVGKQMVYDIGMYACGALVVVGGLWLGYLGVFGHLKSQKTVGLSVLFGTLFFVLVGAFLFFLQRVRQQDRLVTQPQPNVVFGDAKLRGPLVAGQKVWVDITLINTNDVPAEVKFSNITWNLVSLPFDNQLEYDSKGLTSQVSIAAHEIHIIHFDLTYVFTKEDINGLNNAVGFMFAFGKGEYWSEKSPDTKHPLPFCLYYHKDTPGLLANCSKDIKIVEEHPGSRYIRIPEARTTQNR